jgi:enediyne biosynthesis protein E4
MGLLDSSQNTRAKVCFLVGVCITPTLWSATAQESAPLFRDVAAQTGLDFVHVNGSSGQFYMPEIMGSGAAVFDYDGDADLDVFLVQGKSLGTAQTDSASRVGPGSRLFRNDLPPSPPASARQAQPALERPDLRFTDVTEQAGIRHDAVGMGVAAGDYDNDGDPDLYVTAFGPNVLYRNNGDGTFTDVTASAGVDDPRWSTSAAWVDYDRDSHLDLFVANYIDFTVTGNKTCYDSVGARDYCTPSAYHPVPGRLFRNDGRGRFVDVSTRSGINRTYGAGLGVGVGDFNGDGWLDIYVANDATPNQLWINQRDGSFVDEGPLSGAAYNAVGLPEGSMGVAVGDPDDDGDDDLFVTNLTKESHAFYVNRGRAEFEDARATTGIGAATAPYTGFGTDWFDYDNDGRLDLFIADGAVNTQERQRGSPSPFRQPNQLLWNAGGLRFEDVSDRAGPAFAVEEISRGAAFGDLDNDGDIDIVVTNNNGPVRLLLNETAGGRGLLLNLEGVKDNRFGLGSRVELRIGPGSRTIWRRAHSDGSYLSSSDPRVHVGLGTANRAEVTVQWVSGHRETWTGLAAGARTLRQGTGASTVAACPPERLRILQAAKVGPPVPLLPPRCTIHLLWNAILRRS